MEMEQQIKKVKRQLTEEQTGVEELLEREERRNQHLKEVLGDFQDEETRVKRMLDESKKKTIENAVKRIEEDYRTVEDENKSRSEKFTGAVEQQISSSDERIRTLQDAVKQMEGLESDRVGAVTPIVDRHTAEAVPARPPLLQRAGPSVNRGTISFWATSCSGFHEGQKMYSPEMMISKLQCSIVVTRGAGPNGLFIGVAGDVSKRVHGPWRARLDCSLSLVKSRDTHTEETITKNHSTELTGDKNEESWDFSDYYCRNEPSPTGDFAVDRIRVEATFTVKDSMGLD